MFAIFLLGLWGRIIAGLVLLSNIFIPVCCKLSVPVLQEHLGELLGDWKVHSQLFSDCSVTSASEAALGQHVPGKKMSEKVKLSESQILTWFSNLCLRAGAGLGGALRLGERFEVLSLLLKMAREDACLELWSEDPTE